MIDGKLARPLGTFALLLLRCDEMAHDDCVVSFVKSCVVWMRDECGALER